MHILMIVLIHIGLLRGNNEDFTYDGWILIFCQILDSFSLHLNFVLIPIFRF